MAERTIVVTFTLGRGTTSQQAEEAVETMVTYAPIEMGVLIYEGCEVRYD